MLHDISPADLKWAHRHQIGLLENRLGESSRTSSPHVHNLYCWPVAAWGNISHNPFAYFHVLFLESEEVFGLRFKMVNVDPGN